MFSKKIIRTLFLFLMLFFSSCDDEKKNNTYKSDFDLIKKYMKIEFSSQPNLIGTTTSCYDGECSDSHIFQLSSQQSEEFKKHLKDSEKWKATPPYYFCSKPVRMSDNRYLIIEYISWSDILMVGFQGI